MKKLIALLLFASLAGVAYAEETADANQKIDIEDTKATVAVLKKPGNANAKQDARVKNIWFSVIVLCDGKIYNPENVEE